MIKTSTIGFRINQFLDCYNKIVASACVKNVEKNKTKRVCITKKIILGKEVKKTVNADNGTAIGYSEK